MRVKLENVTWPKFDRINTNLGVNESIIWVLQEKLSVDESIITKSQSHGNGAIINVCLGADESYVIRTMYDIVYMVTKDGVA